MLIRTISSGSQGNCHILTHGNEMLILDLGISAKDIKKAINFRVADVSGCLVTHRHLDHSKSLADFKNMGIPCFTPYTDENKNQLRRFGDFTVQSFEVPHDNEPCVGYFIKVGGLKIVYATDFEYLPVSFNGLGVNMLIIECNHIKDYIDRDAENFVHSVRGHAEIQTTIGIIKDNISDNLKCVILCHLSKTNCNAEEVLAEVQKIASCPVYVACKGLEVEV